MIWYGAVCFQFTQFPRDGWENILLCLIIIIKSEVWTVIHCLRLGQETMLCAVCLFIFLYSIYIKRGEIQMDTSQNTYDLTQVKDDVSVMCIWEVTWYSQRSLPRCRYISYCWSDDTRNHDTRDHIYLHRPQNFKITCSRENYMVNITFEMQNLTNQMCRMLKMCWIVC